MGEKEKERDQVAGELEQLEREAATQRSLGAITEDQVVDALRAIAVDIAAGKDVPGLRDQIMRLLERVELDPEQPGEVVLHYRLPAIGGLTGVSMASPQGFERYPGASPARAPGVSWQHGTLIVGRLGSQPARSGAPVASTERRRRFSFAISAPPRPTVVPRSPAMPRGNPRRATAAS
jgi:hypothetical protein